MIVVLCVLVAAATVAAIVFGVFYSVERTERKRLQEHNAKLDARIRDKNEELKGVRKSRDEWFEEWKKAADRKSQLIDEINVYKKEYDALARELDDLAIATIDMLCDAGKVTIESPAKPAKSINGATSPLGYNSKSLDI